MAPLVCHVPIQSGSHKLGPDNATLRVKTTRQGAAAKAGHDLVIEVSAWEATLDIGEDPAQIEIALDADPGSLRVREGTGGVHALGDEDRAEIEETIDDEVLTGKPIEFRSTEVDGPDSRLSVSGELKLAGSSHPLEFELSLSPEGKLSGGATVKQSDWGIKPYSGLFGALKVTDEVEVLVEATVPQD